jgi:2-polyprenyl-3-methyl-5-hydroxy-6-metoxy-1,4-benzoquinol methylase
MVMHPLTQAWRLDERDVSVNYLLMATKPLA